MNATAQGETLHQACYTGALLAVQAFIDGGARCDVKDSDARTPLHWAAMAGHADIVRLLLQRPETAAVLNSQDDEGFGTLHSAAASGRSLIIEQLIAAGADVNIRTRSGQTPLHYHKGRVPVIKALVIAMRDVDPRDMAGATPLHRAAGPGYTDAIRELLLHGADINARDRHGNTPLHLACEENREPAALLLIENGARLDISNEDKKTPFDVCIDKKLANALRSRSASGT